MDPVTVSIPIPPRFAALCERHGITPAEVLEGFAADASALLLTDGAYSGNADDYACSGSDEVELARAYFARAHA